MILATDLDKTLVFSEKYIDKENIDNYEKVSIGNYDSYMTKNAIKLFDKLNTEINIIPCTTRSKKVFANLPLLNTTKYAICSNGGKILIDGEEDSRWNEVVNINMSMCIDELVSFGKKLKEQEFTDKQVRLVDGYFIYSKSNNKEECIKYIEMNINREKFYYLYSSDKIYVFPNFLTKKHALSYLLGKINDEDIYIAGDTQVDFDMMSLATKKCFIPLYDDKKINVPYKNVVFLNDFNAFAGEKILEEINKIFEEERI